MRRLADNYWYSLKDRVRIRGGNKCEYCQLRQIRALHHRHYRTEGAEKMCDVMVVCKICHRVIHGRHKKSYFRVLTGSLADQGDTGMDGRVSGKPWRAYLARRA